MRPLQARILTLALLLPAAALARDPGGEFRVSSGYLASVGMDDEGGFVVSWMTGGGYDVKARRFGPDGKPATGEFEVGHISSQYTGPTSTTLDRSGFLVVWEVRYHHGPSYDLGQRFDRDGHPLSGPFQPTGFSSKVASDPAGNSVIVGGAFSNGNVVATRRNAAGQRVGRAIRVAHGADPDVTMDAAGNFVVAWRGSRGILVRRYDANGAPRSGAVQVAERVESLSGPVLAGNRQGLFAVVWRTGTSIWARFYSSSGEPRTGPVLVVTDAIDRYSSVVAAMDAEGKVLVSWDCCLDDFPSKSTIYGRWLESSGALSGRAFRISAPTGNHYRPDAASGPKNRFLVVWEDSREAETRLLGRPLAFARPGDDPCLLRRGNLACDTAHDGGEEELLFPFRDLGSDTPLLGDLDGDGDDDPCRYHPGRFLCDIDHDGRASELTLAFGRAGDRPLLGDLDGEGRDDACVYRNNEYLCDSAHNGGTPEIVVPFGRPGDLPFLADIDGDGDDDPCVARGGLLLCDREHDGGSEDLSVSVDFGAQGDVLLLGDVDDDGRADLCVHREGRFLCDTRRDGSADLIIPFNLQGAVPFLGNLDGL